MMMKKALVVAALSCALLACKEENKAADANKPAETAAPAAAAGKDAGTPAAAVADTDKVAYAIGVNVAKNVQHNIDGLKQLGYTLNSDAIARGLSETLAGKPAMTDDQLKDTLTKFSQELEAKQKEMQEKAQAEEKAKAEENKTKGAEFLAANAKKDGWKVTKSGLQYKVLTEGKGPKPKESDTVKVHYTGTLIDGTKFDSSYDRKEPAEFGVGQVIKGWVEALQLMPVGSKYQLAIPAELAYGEAGRPGIPANSVLLFDVELLDIVKPEAEAKKDAK